ncbi:MAG TPA: hypothetical protein VGU73_02640 [Acidimicrobiia bacterium]|nr:hypothetical protein [Acidimicrobiia bacterium]
MDASTSPSSDGLERQVQDLRDELSQARAEAAEAYAAARYAQDEAAVAAETIVALRQELAASQLRAAKALADAQEMNANVETLRATRTYRNALVAQTAYEKVRHAIRSLGRRAASE